MTDVSDPDGDDVALVTEVYTAQLADAEHLVTTCFSGYVVSGSRAVCEVSDLIDGQTQFYARSKVRDTRGMDSTYSAWFSFTTPEADHATEIDGDESDASNPTVDPVDVSDAADMVWSTSDTAPPDSLSVTTFGMMSAASLGPPSGYGIPDANWAGCGLFDKDVKMVKQYYRRAIYNTFQRMAGSHSDLNCGTEGWGYRHVLKRHTGLEPDAGDWKLEAAPVNRNWRDVASWATSWVVSDPDVVYWVPATKPNQKDGFCESRQLYLYKKLRNGGWERVRSRIIRVTLGETGVRIITSYPSDAGHCKTGKRVL